jgi:3-dehydroquinate synthase
LLHGEAVAWGMIAAGRLGERIGVTPSEDRRLIEEAIRSYGTIPPLEGVSAESVAARVAGDKKTIGGKAHFVLAERIGKVVVRDDVPHDDIVAATREALEAAAPEPVE